VYLFNRGPSPNLGSSSVRLRLAYTLTTPATGTEKYMQTYPKNQASAVMFVLPVWTLVTPRRYVFVANSDSRYFNHIYVVRGLTSDDMFFNILRDCCD